MKQLVFSVSAMMIVMFFLIPTLTMGDKTTRARKLDDATASVTKQVLEESMENAGSAGMTDGDIKSLVYDKLASRLGESADIDVTVEKCDLKKGILSVHVTEQFKNPGKKTDVLETEKTCILEQEQMRPLVTVEFYLPDYTPEPSSTYTTGFEKLYISCEIMAGDDIRFPETPPDIILPTGRDSADVYRFDHWNLKINGKEVDYNERKLEKAGSDLLSADGSLYGRTVFEASYVKAGTLDPYDHNAYDPREG